MVLQRHIRAHRIGSHSYILKDIGAVQEKNVVSVRREGGAQGGVQRRVGSNRKGASWSNPNIDLHNAQLFGLKDMLNSALSANFLSVNNISVYINLDTVFNRSMSVVKNIIQTHQRHGHSGCTQSCAQVHNVRH